MPKPGLNAAGVDAAKARAFRRSELVALDVAGIAEAKTGLLVTIRRSKTEQKGEGVAIAIAGVTSPALPGLCGNGWMLPVSKLARSFGQSTRAAPWPRTD